MARDLLTTRRRFLAAEQISIDAVSVRWENYEKFDESLRAAYRAAKRTSALPKHQALFNLIWDVHDNLALGPWSPSDAGLGLGAAVEQLGSAETELPEIFGELRSSAEGLYASSHPANDIYGLLTTHGLDRHLQVPELAVVVSTRFKRNASTKIQVRDSQFDLLDLRELRDGVWDCVVLVGTQAPLSEQFQSREEALRELSWLYTAPAAPRMVVVTWSGAIRFDFNDYVIREELRLPEVNDYGAGSVTQWGVSRKRQVKKIKLSGDADTDCFNFVVDAIRDVRSSPTLVAEKESDGAERNTLNQEWVVSFVKSVPPRPRLLVPDDYGLAIETIEDPSRFPIGGLLVIREDLPLKRRDRNDESHDVGEQPTQDLVRQLATKALGDPVYRSLRSKSDNFKKELARCSNDFQWSVQRLREAGFENPEYYLNVHKAKQWIGPGSRDKHQKLSKALSIPDDASTYEAIAAIRSAHQSAGFEITKRITSYLETNREWEEECRMNNTVAIDSKSFGRVILARVLDVQAGRCSLGQVGLRRIAEAYVDTDQSGEDIT
jgi:hypothetical protein